MVDEEEILVNPLDNLDDVENKTTPNLKEEKENSADNDKLKEEDKKEEQPVKKVSPEKEKRHQQQEDWKLAEIKRLRWLVIDKEVKAATEDATSLLELHNKDAKMAKEVADKFDRSETARWSYEDFLASKWAAENKPKPVSEDEIEKRVEQRLAQREHEAALVEAKKLFEELPEEAQEEAVDEFNDLIEGKTLTIEKALKYAKLVTLSLWKQKKADTTGTLKKLSSSGMSTTKKATNTDKVMIILPNGDEVFLPSNEID